MQFRAGLADRSVAMRGRAHAAQVGSSLTYSYKGHRWTNDVNDVQRGKEDEVKGKTKMYNTFSCIMYTE